MAVIGTRPEAIKLLPVVAQLRCRPGVKCRVVATGQHEDLVAPVFDAFGIQPDANLRVMRHGQTLAELVASGLTRLEKEFEESRPGMVLVQGDTSSAFCGALAAFSARIPLAHVEAGLRTGDPTSPFPEEFNRRAVALMAALHFAPTERARENLLQEGVPRARIFVTGNTVVDALRTLGPDGEGPSRPPYVVVTTHRRENWGEGQRSVCRAVLRLSDEFSEYGFLVFLHPNPLVRSELVGGLAGRDRVDLVEPASYPDFIRLMRHATLVMSDSGGVQEEAVALGVPLLVLREKTERPEVLESGIAWLVGTELDQIVDHARAVLRRPGQLKPICNPHPFGDGRAAVRIVDVLTA